MQLSDIQGHVTNDESIDDGTDNKDGYSNDNLTLSPRTNLSNTKQIEADVHTDEVTSDATFFVGIIIEFIYLWRSKPNKVHIGNPLLSFRHNIVPNTSHKMDIQEHEYDQLDDLQCGLDLLACIGIHDDTVHSEDTGNLQETENVELWGEEVQWYSRDNINEELATL